VHQAPRDQNGPIVFNLDVTPGDDNRSGTFEGQATLSDAQWQAFKDGELYVNIHTLANPQGALRGQLAPPATNGSGSTTAASGHTH
jgi:hypothetical protein